MVQILPPQERPRNLQRLLGSLPGILEEGVGAIMGERKRSAEEEALEKLGVPRGVTDPNLRKQLLDMEQKRQEASRKMEMGGEDISKELKDLGMSDEEADLWSKFYKKSSQGGKTQIISDISERKKRGEFETPESKTLTIESPYNPEIFGDARLEFEPLPKETGRTPTETVRREDAREKQNTKIYDSLESKLNTLEAQERDLGLMNDLNESKKLPTGVMERLKINPKSGDLLIPALANAETQLYVKILNGFIKHAKDFFPGRVTNFDLQTFQTILPTLSNTEEGRRLIIKYMDLTNKIAHLKDDLLRKTYDHYGVGKIDSATAKKIANENYNRLKPQLENELKNMTRMMKTESENTSKMMETKSPFKPGTQATNEVVDWYLDTYGHDLAEQKARDDGIQF